MSPKFWQIFAAVLIWLDCSKKVDPVQASNKARAVAAEQKTSLLVSSSECYLDLLLILLIQSVFVKLNKYWDGNAFFLQLHRSFDNTFSRRNKLASLKTTLVRNYDRPTDQVTDGNEVRKFFLTEDTRQAVAVTAQQ